MTEAATRPPASVPLRQVGSFVHLRAEGLQSRLLRDDSTGVAALARLRRGVGVPPGEHVDLLPITHDDRFIPTCGDDPSASEWAVHVALTLFALHQQSQSRRMHKPGVGLGAALRVLGGPDSPTVRRRFQVLGTAEEFSEMTHHLRGVVQLLRQGGEPLDYGRLADDLVRWQTAPRGPASVRLRWGREFYRTPEKPSGTGTDQETTS